MFTETRKLLRLYLTVLVTTSERAFITTYGLTRDIDQAIACWYYTHSRVCPANSMTMNDNN